MQEDNTAGKSESAKTRWQPGFKAWVGKHEMTFDTLKALRLAGWCLLFIAFFLPFQYSENVFVPALSLLASLLYAALALAFYFELL